MATVGGKSAHATDIQSTGWGRWAWQGGRSKGWGTRAGSTAKGMRDWSGWVCAQDVSWIEASLISANRICVAVSRSTRRMRPWQRGHCHTASVLVEGISVGCGCC